MLNKTFTDSLIDDFQEGQIRFADDMRLLIYKTDPVLFDLLDFENDQIFLEPLLFAYFNEKNPPLSLNHILFGYIEEAKKPAVLEVVTDKRGIVFLPEIGYLKTSLPSQNLQLNWNQGLENLKLSYQGKALDFLYEPILKLQNINIEIWRYPHLLSSDYIRDWDFENHIEKEMPAKIEVQQTLIKHLQQLENAFELLKKYVPSQYHLYELGVKRIALYHHPNTISFAVRNVHGVSFFTLEDENDELFFLEEISHQCAHIIFNAITYDLDEFFKIEGDQVGVKEYSHMAGEVRSIYSAYHGLFTVSNRVETFGILYDHREDIFEGKQLHEFLGRFALLRGRFRTGLEKVDFEEVFTPKGLRYYQMLDDFCVEGFKRVPSLLHRYDFSNQDRTFSYERFIQSNDLASQSQLL